MAEKKLPIRKKGRAETIIEDLSKHGLSIVGISKQDGVELILQIDSKNPYKDGGVFGLCDFYRVLNSEGRPVIDKRHLSGIRKWIDSGEIQEHETLAERRRFEELVQVIISTYANQT